MRQDFTLLPWRSESDAEPGPDLQVTGWIDRCGDSLEIQYRLVGDLGAVEIAPPAELPTRRFALWERTCLEFFLAPIGQAHYWEFNLSPSGDWNVFRLEGYREGLRDETCFQQMACQVHRQERELGLFLQVSLADLVSVDQPLVAAVTAVVQDRAGNCSYWALCHPGPAADFHRRDGFTIELPAAER